MSVPAVSRYAFVLILLTLFALAVPAQRLTQGSKPARESVTEYSDAFCSKLTGEFRLCKVKTSEDGDADYVVMKGTAAVNRIPAPAWEGVAVAPDGFFAYRGNLDKDGSQEIVLVSLEGVSNGMGVSYSTAYIFDGSTVESKGTPISFSIQEFSEKESFIYDPQSGRTEILVTYWDDRDSIEPKRNPGVYLIGKFFRYERGKLRPVLEKPTLARRFLNSFAAERDNGWFENRKPYTWLKDRRTLKLSREPEELTKPTAVLTGTIRSFTTGENSSIQFETTSGEAIKGIFESVSSDEPAEKTVNIHSIGLWNKRFTYPMSYSMTFDPTVYFEKFEGRQVKIETYRSRHGDDYAKVWLLDE